MTAVLHDEAADTRALVDAAKAGDRDAFGALYTHYHHMVRSMIGRRIHDQHLADDLTQDVFRRALGAIFRYEHRGRDFGAFLTTIAKNQIIDYFKSGAYRLEPRPAGTDSYAERVDTDPCANPEIHAVNGADSAILAGAIGRLNPEQRQCIELRFLQGLSVAEAAAVLGKNEGAVKALQYRAKAALRRDPAMEALR